jgi:hypothetical protein
MLQGPATPGTLTINGLPVELRPLTPPKSPSRKFVLVQHSLGLIASNAAVCTDGIRSGFQPTNPHPTSDCQVTDCPEVIS